MKNQNEFEWLEFTDLGMNTSMKLIVQNKEPELADFTMVHSFIKRFFKRK